MPIIKTSGIKKLAEFTELLLDTDEFRRFVVAGSALRFGILFRVVIVFLFNPEIAIGEMVAPLAFIQQF